MMNSTFALYSELLHPEPAVPPGDGGAGGGEPRSPQHLQQARLLPQVEIFIYMTMKICVLMSI